MFHQPTVCSVPPPHTLFLTYAPFTIIVMCYKQLYKGYIFLTLLLYSHMFSNSKLSSPLCNYLWALHIVAKHLSVTILFMSTYTSKKFKQIHKNQYTWMLHLISNKQSSSSSKVCPLYSGFPSPKTKLRHLSLSLVSSSDSP
jgi:tellurite resistance protein TehA-like permease